MNKLTDLFFLSLYWILFSLPVVTIGAATVALYQFMLKQVDDTEGYAFRSFWKAFKENFKQATLLWLVFVAGCAFFFFDYEILFSFPLPSGVQILVFAVVTCLCFLFAVMSCFAFPLLACFRISLGKALKDALVMGMQHLPVTLLVLGIHAFFLWTTVKAPYLGPLFFSLALFSGSYLFKPVFRSYLAS